MTEISNEDMNAVDAAIWGAVRVAILVDQTVGDLERAPDGEKWTFDEEAGNRLTYLSGHLLKSLRELQELYDKAIKPPQG
jgi:hypothetical protein